MKFNNKHVIGKNVKIGNNVKIGDNTIIYDNVTILDDTVIADNCSIGEPLNAYYFEKKYENPKTIIGSGSLIRSYSIIYASNIIKNKLLTGHHVTIRENSQIGENCQVGSYSDIQGDCEIGDNCRMQSYVGVGKGSNIGNYVFLYPFVILTNDPTPPSETIFGVSIGDYSIITTSSVLLPGTQIGKNCLVSANSCVNGKYEEDSFISGNPAKLIGKLSKMPFFNEMKIRHYPWMNNFDRNMPWNIIGYKEWKKKND
ncbi:MAG TPA: hypothetical protein PKY46_07770 [Ignavibacteriaceae bacterium]|nr:hypothetical protein [Ignavibacteriaceae bacterium]